MSTKEFGPSNEWEKEFNRIKSNPIYFIEYYWNKINPDNKPVLTKEEKQRLFDQHKGVPLFSDFEKAREYHSAIEKLKEQGYEDWEIIP